MINGKEDQSLMCMVDFALQLLALRLELFRVREITRLCDQDHNVGFDVKRICRRDLDQKSDVANNVRRPMQYH